MATYTSKTVTINQPAETLSAKFSDFTVLQQRLDAMDPQQRQAVGDISFTSDSINIHTPQMGNITLKAVERTAEALTLKAEGSPVPMTLKVNFKAVGSESTEVCGAIDVDIPAIIKPMVGPTLQKAADKFGDLFAGLA